MQTLVKKRIREDITKFNHEKIGQIIEESQSTKKVKKEVSERNSLIMKLGKEDGKVKYNREGIVKIAKKLYVVSKRPRKKKY